MTHKDDRDFQDRDHENDELAADPELETLSNSLKGDTSNSLLWKLVNINMSHDTLKDFDDYLAKLTNLSEEIDMRCNILQRELFSVRDMVEKVRIEHTRLKYSKDIYASRDA